VPQHALADDVVRLIHGEGEAKRAESAARSLFAGGGGLPEAIDAARANGAPTTRRPRAELDPGVPLPQLIAAVRLCDSTSAARREIAGGGISLNQEPVKDVARAVTAADLIDGRFVLLRRGKRNFHIVEFA
jgi:tyrosyl-tRNA synthetase